MGSDFTFDDIRSSKPLSAGDSAKIAKLTARIARLKAHREIVAVAKRSGVAKVDDEISTKERRLKQLTSGEPRKPAK